MVAKDLAEFKREIEVLDTHTEGNPTRIILNGGNLPHNLSLQNKYNWLKNNDDQLRRLLNFEPRGNPMMCSVYLTPPTTDAPSADFAAVIMEQDEYVPMCGHCIIGAATAVVHLGLVPVKNPVTTIVFETLAGLVECEVKKDPNNSATWVSFMNVESFLLHKDTPLVLDRGQVLLADIAFGGDFYAIVDSNQLNIRVDSTNERGLSQLAREITASVNNQTSISHPENPLINKCYEVLFTCDSTGPSAFKHAVISPPGTLDRSPCGTGTSARIASLHARGLVTTGCEYSFEGPLGTRFFALVQKEHKVNGLQMITPRIRGRGFITGHSRLLLESADPFPQGLRIHEYDDNSLSNNQFDERPSYG